MEEKNTPERNGNENKKQKFRPRRHGYFIEPPTDAPVADGSATDNSTAQKSSAPHGQKQNKPHHKGDRPEGQKNDKNEKNQNRSNNDAPPKNQNTQPQAGQGNQQKKKKKKNKNKQPQGDQAVAAKQNATTAQSPTPEKAIADKAQNGKKRFPGDKRTVESKAVSTHAAEDYEEYKLTFDEDVNSAPRAAEEEVPKTEVVGIRFKSTGKVYYFDPNGKTYPKGSKAIVDTARGQEFGEVAMTNAMIRSSDIVPPLRTVIRSATQMDIEHHKENKKKEEEAFKVCNEKIVSHGLDMKLIDAQYTFDNTKLLFYFTSSDRVDFRNLVKDLASVFRTRIELRQIGIRDEAKLMGGLGMCGRPLCCTLFLSDFDQVSIKMAKEQNLSLNSAKISGICGRLMCCLRYEHEAYEYEIKRTPPVDSLVRTENGDGVVTEISPLQGTVKVKLFSSPDVPPKTYKRDEVTMLRKKQNDTSRD